MVDYQSDSQRSAACKWLASWGQFLDERAAEASADHEPEIASDFQIRADEQFERAAIFA